MKQLIWLLLMFLPLLSSGQRKKDIAREHLINLKNGALLVRLPTSQLKIKALLEAGKEKTAEETARNQQLENIATYTAFKGAYKFSEVYFFYNLSSEKISKGEFQGHLLNENLDPDPDIELKEENIYIADFTTIETTGLSALVIKDQNFNMLQKPFPYYVKLYNLIPVTKKNKLDIVVNLNKNLFRSYKRKTRKLRKKQKLKFTREKSERIPN